MTRRSHRLSRRKFLGASAIAMIGAQFGPGHAAHSQGAASGQAPASAGPVDPGLIEDLVLGNRILALEGVVDSQGHVSMRHPRDPNRYLMSDSRAPAIVEAGDILEFDLDSNPVDARGRSLYQERFIHGEVYKVRPDVGAVVHNHSPSVIPFSVSSVRLRAMAHSGAFLGDGLPIFDIRRAGGMTNMLVSSPSLGRALAESLGNSAAVLMRGHGAVVVAPTLRRVIGRSVYLEVNARLQREAMALGGTIEYLDPEEARKIEEGRGYERQWELWRHKVLGASK